MTLLSNDEIERRLATLKGWRREGHTIERTFRFDTFAHAVRFVQRVAELADRADHHPDIDIRYDRVTLRLSTHSAGGLTRRDTDLAASIDALG